MGTTYHCHCKTCDHDFTVYDGDGMHSIGLICSSCGKRSSVPRHAPRPPREGRQVPKFLQTSRFFSLPPIPDEQIRRFTDNELTNIDDLCKAACPEDTDKWDAFETAALIANKNPCPCGGVVDIAAKSVTGGVNAMSRCPVCLSKALTSNKTGLWD